MRPALSGTTGADFEVSFVLAMTYELFFAGNPKGAVLLHETLAAASVANQHGGGPLNSTSVSISYMPVRPV